MLFILLKYANHMNFKPPRREMHKKEGLNKINLPSYCFREKVSGLQHCHISTRGPFVKLLEGKERCGATFQTDSWAIMQHNAQNREKLHITVHLNIPSQHSETREIKLNTVELLSADKALGSSRLGRGRVREQERNGFGALLLVLNT